MKDETRKLIIIFGVLLIVGMLLISGIPNFRLFGQDDYGTGLNINTSTQTSTLTKAGDFDKKGQEFLKSAGTEIFTHDKYIVSWLPKEFSQLITMRSDFQYNPLWWHGYLGWGWVNEEGVTLGRYYFTVDYIDPRGNVTRIIDTHDGVDSLGHMWDTNYVEMDKNRMVAMIPDFDWQSDTAKASSGRFYSQGGGGFLLPNAVYRDTSNEGNWWERVSVTNAPLQKWREPHSQQGWETLSTDTMEFHMKGLRIGALRVKYYIDTAQTYTWGLGGILYEWKWGGWQQIAQDECFLASGSGSIDILSSNHVPGAPQQEVDQAQEKNAAGKTTDGDYYTKFVYEEGSTIQISVDTGYSGTALNPGETGYGEGWTLAIYNGQGVQVQAWDKIADNLRGKILSYTVPKGSFIPGGNNEWRVVLKNTLFDQAETRLFVVDSFAKIPGPVKITLDKTQYKEGDTVYVGLTATANTRGSGEITSFWIDVKYGSESSMYRVGGFPTVVPAKKGLGLNFTLNYNFVLENLRPVTLDSIYIRVHAIDKDGRAGVEGEKKGVYIEQQVPGTTQQQYLPQLGDITLLFIIIAIIIIVVVAYVLILYKQGRLKIRKGGRKR